VRRPACLCDVRRACATCDVLVLGGTAYAVTTGMSARHFQDLECWRLADELRKEVHAICRKPNAATDRRFCDNFRDAVGSVCRNIAEGFVRFRSGEIVKFFEYALASLAEVMDALVDCQTRELIDGPQAKRLDDLANHVKATATNFMLPHKRKIEVQRRQKRRT
jgi:four helix bundle protein